MSANSTFARPRVSSRPDKTLEVQSDVLVDAAEAAKQVSLLGVQVTTETGKKPVEYAMRPARTLRFADYAPIRYPMAYQGQVSKPGFYYLSHLDEFISYESRAEMAHLMIIDADPTVTAVVSQPFRLVWRQKGGRKRSHVPDFFVAHDNGVHEVIDVKGSLQAHRASNALVFEVTRLACERLGMVYRVAHEVDQTLHSNLVWLDGYRHTGLTDAVGDLGAYVFDAVMALTDQEAAASAEPTETPQSGSGETARGRTGLTSGPTIGAVINLAAEMAHVLPIQVRPVVFFLMRTRDLGADLSVPLQDSTRLWVGGLS